MLALMFETQEASENYQTACLQNIYNVNGD